MTILDKKFGRQFEGVVAYIYELAVIVGQRSANFNSNKLKMR